MISPLNNGNSFKNRKWVTDEEIKKVMEKLKEDKGTLATVILTKHLVYNITYGRDPPSKILIAAVVSNFAIFSRFLPFARRVFHNDHELATNNVFLDNYFAASPLKTTQ